MAAIEWGIDPSILRIEHKAVGDCLRMQAGTYHRFWSAVDRPTVLLEVSSHHDDGDVERLQESAPL
jgi:mannose-6-phosphate isomerase-like protein (cupin superfamily)